MTRVQAVPGDSTEIQNKVRQSRITGEAHLIRPPSCLSENTYLQLHFHITLSSSLIRMISSDLLLPTLSASRGAK